jgi:hypothetical protein
LTFGFIFGFGGAGLLLPVPPLPTSMIGAPGYTVFGGGFALGAVFGFGFAPPTKIMGVPGYTALTAGFFTRSSS